MRIAITATGADLEANVDPRFGRCPCFLIVETDDLSFEAVENPNLTLGSGAGIQSAQLMAAKGVKHVLTGNCGPNAHQTLSAAGIGVIVGCSGPVRNVIEQYKAGQFTAAGEPNVASHFGIGSAVGGVPDQPPGLQQPPMTGGGMGMGRGAGRGMGGGMGRGGGMGQGGGGGMGMGRGAGRGMGGGMGRGRGMGQGGGRGMGGGMGQGRGMGQGGGTGGGMGAAFPQGAVPMSQGTPEALTKNNELTVLKQQAEEMAQQTQQIHERIQQLEKGGKTGTMVAKVDSENCTGCGICVDICPAEAISLENDLAVVDEQTCTACGLCVDECPNEAIAMG